MGNIPKQGIDYFDLDVDFLDDIKVRKITRACGAQAVAVLISLLCRIYRFEGYYMVLDDDATFLIAEQTGVRESLVQSVVEKATSVGFFDAALYKERRVLTSGGIQRRFFNAVKRRSVVRYNATLVPNLQNVSKNAIDVNKNPIDVDRNPQSRVEESRVEERREQQAEAGGRSAKTPPPAFYSRRKQTDAMLRKSRKRSLRGDK